MSGGFPIFAGYVVIDSTNKALRMKENTTLGGTGLATVNLVEGNYVVRGDGADDDLIEGLMTAMGTHGNVTTPNKYSAVLQVDPDHDNDSGLVQISRATGGSSWQILWTDPLTTFPGELLGFVVDDAFDATAKSSTLSPAGIWVSNDIYRKRDPVPVERKAAVVRACSGRTQGMSRSAQMRSWSIGLSFIAEERMLAPLVNTGDPDSALESFLERFGANAAVEFHDVDLSGGALLSPMSTATRTFTGHFTQQTLETFAPERMPSAPLYSVDLVFHERVE